MHYFVNLDIFKWLNLAYVWVYLHQTWGFCKTWSALYDYDIDAKVFGLYGVINVIAPKGL